MKWIAILAMAMAMAMVPGKLLAQSNTIESVTETGLDWWASQIVIESLSVSAANPGLIQGGVTYTGIGVQLIQAEQPLQLLNPLAPKSYGTGEQNVIRDMFTRQPVGLRLFSFNF